MHIPHKTVTVVVVGSRTRFRKGLVPGNLLHITKMRQLQILAGLLAGRMAGDQNNDYHCLLIPQTEDEIINGSWANIENMLKQAQENTEPTVMRVDRKPGLSQN
jgi:hypothetical protein